MLFADEWSVSLVQTLQVIATVAIAAWVTIQTRRIDTRQKEGDVLYQKEKKRCDALERRVKALEGPPKTKPPKPRAK